MEPDFSGSIFLDHSELKDEISTFNKLGNTFTGVPGRLLGKSAFYLEVDASQYIIDTVKDGYKLLFVNDIPPPRFHKRNNKSALDQSNLLTKNLNVLRIWGAYSL